MKTIQYPDPLLTQVSQPMTTFDGTLQAYANQMIEHMIASGGIGLSAVQVGRLDRMFVLDKSLCDHNQVFINPSILSADGVTVYSEGCLSFPGIQESITRKQNIHVEFQNVRGEFCAIHLSGLAAIAFQHELDHLNGITLVQKVSRQARRAIERKFRK